MRRSAAGRSDPIGDSEFARIFAPLEGRTLALAVSGGADSMALMHLVARWLALKSPGTPPAAPPTTDTNAPLDWIAGLGGDIARLPPAIVLTVDHGLRPQAAEEAAFVRDAARRLGLPCAILRWECDKPATGVQDAARNARRGLMCDLIAAERAAVEVSCGVRPEPRVLVMAHHLEDQAETLLMRLGRGSGLDGLKGMSAEAATGVLPDVTGDGAIRIVRPLLGIAKQRLVATLRADGIAWIDDPSNDDPRFERVRIRKALATLAELGIGADKIALSARRLADAAEWIEFGARPAAADGARDIGAEVERFVRGIDWNGGVEAVLALPGTAAFEVPRYAVVRTLRQVLESVGGAGREPELQQLETLAELIRARYADLPDDMTLGGCRLVFSTPRAGGRRLIVFREGAGAKSGSRPCAPGGVTAWDGGRFVIRAAQDAPAGGVVQALGPEGWSGLKRRVPGLAVLGWRADAAATLPVIAVAGEVVAHPGVAAALADCTRPSDALRDALVEAWAALAAAEAGGYSARFRVRPW